MADSKQLVFRTLDILECLASERRGLNLSDISLKTDLSKSTAFRILSTLVNKGFITKNEQTGYYRTSMKIVHLATILLNELELHAEAYRYLYKLSSNSGLTARLGVIRGNDVAYLDCVTKFFDYRSYSATEVLEPCVKSACGLALLGEYSDEDLIFALNSAERAYPQDKYDWNRAEVFERIEQGRKDGYYYCASSGVQQAGTIVKDYNGKPLAAISLSDDMSTVANEMFFQWIPILQREVAKLSSSLGFVESE
jgi:DNA-binding IclR family transcriptional regulator